MSRETYICDGMPTMRGCGEEITPTRPFVYPHRPRKSGWLTVPSLDANEEPDLGLLLHFCPQCAVIVRQQMESAS